MLNGTNFTSFFEKIIKYRIGISVILILLFIASLFLINSKLEVDNSLRVWFLEGDPTYQKYLDYQKEQGSDEIISIMLPFENIYSKEYFEKLNILHEKVDSFQFVENSFSLYKAEYPILSVSGLKFRKIYSKDKDLSVIEKKLNSLDYLKDYIVSEDDKSSLFFIQLKPTLEIEGARNELLSLIRNEISKEFGEYYITGIPVLNEGVGKSIRKETGFFSLITMFVILLLLFFFLPNRYYLPIAFVSVMLPIVFLFGIYTLFGIKLNMISTILPTILIVYSLTDVIHVINIYHSQRFDKFDENRVKTIALKLQKSVKPCFFTTVTTMVGYVALYFSLMSALRITGIYAFFGLFLAFITIYVVMAIGLYFLDSKVLTKPSKKPAQKSPAFNKIILFINRLTDKYPKQIIIFSIVLFGVGVFSVTQVRINANILKYMGKGKAKTDYKIMEKNFGGLLRFDLNLISTDSSSIITPKKLKVIESFENKLIEEKLFKGVISLNGLKNRIEKQGKALFLLNPGLKSKLQKDLEKLHNGEKSFFYLLNDDYTKLNLIAKTKISSSVDIMNNTNKIYDIFDQTIPKDMNVKLDIQGYSPLYLKMHKYISKSQINSFGAAFIFAFIFLVLLIKKLRLSALALFPNLLPLMMLAMLLAFFGIEIDSSTIMIAPIMLGIAMDDTIHLIHRYQMYKKETGDVIESMNRAMLFTGQAVSLASLSLALGFLILSLSNVPSIQMFGFLSAVTVVFAFIADIIILPALVKVFDK